jgi:hypothetical protein
MSAPPPGARDEPAELARHRVIGFLPGCRTRADARAAEHEDRVAHVVRLEYPLGFQVLDLEPDAARLVVLQEPGIPVRFDVLAPSHGRTVTRVCGPELTCINSGRLAVRTMGAERTQWP